MTAEEKRKLEDRIENHEIFSLSADERFDATELRNEFSELMMEYMGFTSDRILSVSDAQKTAMLKNDASSGSLLRAFEGEAFMKAIKNLLKQNRQKIPNVCACFRTLYIREMRALMREGQDFRPREKVMRNIHHINRICEASGKQIWELSDNDIRIIASTQEIDLKKLYIEIILYKCSYLQQLTYKEESTDTKIHDELCPEGLDLITHMLDEVLDAEQEEYPRLFWNNSLLRLLKGEKKRRPYLPAGGSDIRKLCKDREESLMNKVFLYDYLLFVLVQPPEPDSIDHIDAADQRRAFTDATIAAYKNVSQDTVSRHRQKFDRLIQNLKVNSF